MQYYKITFDSFIHGLTNAQGARERIKEATTPAHEIKDEDQSCYVSRDVLSGFMVSETGELTSLYSLKAGRGDDMVYQAMRRGACHLDCFDGFLVDFYKRHGFVITARQANWTAGEPDVVYMGRF